MLTFQDNFVVVIAKILKPIVTLPDAAENLDSYENPYSTSSDPIEFKMNELGKVGFFFHQNLQSMLSDLKPRLDSFDRNVLDPLKELTGLIKNIYSVMQKRDHKMLDYDRYRATVSKYEEKGAQPGGRSLPDEQAYHKYGEQYQEASRQYRYYNDMLKTDIRILISLRDEFIYLVMEKSSRIQLTVYNQVYDMLLTAAQHTPSIDLNVDMNQEFRNLWNTAENVLGEIQFAEETKAAGNKFMGSIRGKKKPSPIYKTGSTYSNNPGSVSSAQHSYTSNNPPRYSTAIDKDSSSPSSQLGNRFNSAATNFASNVATNTANNVIASEKDKYFGKSSSQANDSQSQSNNMTRSSGPNYPPLPPMVPKKASTPVYAKALYDYAGQTADDLSFKANDVIEIMERTESSNDWWTGRINGKVGLIPSNYVVLM
ncbi:Regulator of cytoskeleton and endocytosis [Smittium culicis]|uniref:Regulator of cytoskeleton and endocytosis n=1 Tax=Smittium culicis TaxID=133412 RepID=A0A1R1YMW8_9FUNG|nr:Regulator of cytoskeleton and endocytosis [Smittium culicis]